MSEPRKRAKSLADAMLAAVGEVSKRMAEWDKAQDAKRKRRLAKATEFVGVAHGEDGSHFFWFDTMTLDERDAACAAAGQWLEHTGYIYGSALLPKVEPGRRGRWRITVEFEPEEER